ncbi:MAG: S23 ribosomal protein [Candidatus Nomurabacteria bacterium GW2011_GWB1_37_5]|uniref:S23 ribosomal protein n=1 Tax=Candidatus Nomurabacteria bacterium GW2011_GWB1_37_5 TaxID=1618742 RepID=A0A0G0GTI9_9BACT|nr:MAG: S23 ribosomal protein [Candidatus Nomurabacteria bacterium GW2011_GWB1_37_5]
MTEFQNKLKGKMDEYAHLVYRVTRFFPKEEMYSATSQLRRAALSVILNYIEGYARRRPAVQLNFYEISFGSLKESKYLFEFSKDESFVNEKDFRDAIFVADEIGAMLWSEITKLENFLNK